MSSTTNKKKKITKEEYDDENDSWDVHGCKFTLPKRYEVIEALGAGAYGTVVSAFDTKKGKKKKVAIKKIERTFEHHLYAKRTLREIKILRLLQHDNIIDIKTIIKPKSLKDFSEIYVVFEPMETDLGSIIKSDQELTLDHVRFFMYQILRGMKYVHSAGILHRDLKPRNILVNSNCDLKIWDFGLARADIPDLYEAGAMTDYIATRWYRAPELLMGCEDYAESIDTWAIGCIFAELLTRKPFLPGSDSENQLKLIVHMIGIPDGEEIEINGGVQLKVPDSVKIKPDENTKKFSKRFDKWDKVALDLLKKMLQFNPSKRISINDALKHEFFEELHVEDDEPTTSYVSAFDFDFEKYELTTSQTAELIYEEITLYHSAKSQNTYLKNRKKYPKGMLHLTYGEAYQIRKGQEDAKTKMKAILAN
jgi:serine/threonine protein kinase